MDHVLLLVDEPSQKKKKGKMVFGVVLILLIITVGIFIWKTHQNELELDSSAVTTKDTSETVSYGSTGIIHLKDATLDYVFKNPSVTGKYYKFKIQANSKDIVTSDIIAPGYEIREKSNIHVEKLASGTADAKIVVHEIDPQTKETIEQWEEYVCLTVNN